MTPKVRRKGSRSLRINRWYRNIEDQLNRFVFECKGNRIRMRKVKKDNHGRWVSKLTVYTKENLWREGVGDENLLPVLDGGRKVG